MKSQSVAEYRPGADAKGPSEPTLEGLERLILRAGNMPEVDRARLAKAIVSRLRRVPHQAAPEAAAWWLLRALEENTWIGWTDARGRTCRAAAVEALLGLGYPWALHVTPEDLEHYRAQSPAGPSRGVVARALERILRPFTRRPKIDPT
jgi:hypothetical protein